MHKLKTHFPKGCTKEKFPVGPAFPKAGPTLFNAVATIEKDVKKSTPVALTSSVANIKTIMAKNTKPHILLNTSSEIGFSSSFSLRKALD
jgi:hypothetical protein